MVHISTASSSFQRLKESEARLLELNYTTSKLPSSWDRDEKELEFEITMELMRHPDLATAASAASRLVGWLDLLWGDADEVDEDFLDLTSCALQSGMFTDLMLLLRRGLGDLGVSSRGAKSSVQSRLVLVSVPDLDTDTDAVLESHGPPDPFSHAVVPMALKALAVLVCANSECKLHAELDFSDLFNPVIVAPEQDEILYIDEAECNCIRDAFTRCAVVVAMWRCAWCGVVVWRRGVTIRNQRHANNRCQR